MPTNRKQAQAMDDITLWDALQVSDALASKTISAVDLMTATLDRIAATNADVNAIVSLRDAEVLMADARQADDTPRTGWLHGIPMAIKDLANAKGLPNSKGSPLFAGEVAQTDDQLVARLRAAGAIIIGKTNTPEFGLGSHTFNSVFGNTSNPYDLSRSAGGSSGGAAAALAAGMVCLADGSDMMGSLRNPAAWNNVYGMRPTWGLVPPDPVGEMFFKQLSTSGPMARSPRDLAAMLGTIAGPVRHWPFERPSSDFLAQIDAPDDAPRLGWLADWGGAYPMEPGILAHSEAALADMQQLGWQVDALPPPMPASDIWQSWRDLRSFVVAGERAEDYAVPERRKLLKPAMIWEVETGRALSSDAIYRASEIRSEWYRRALDLFEKVDVLVLPSAQVWPFAGHEVHPTEIAGVSLDTYHRWMEVVVPASLIGLPVVNIPAGFGSNGLPIGLQFIGAPGADAMLLRLAERWHQVTQWPQRRPACRDV
ncbi:MAG: amidase [Roseobacter sp.]